MGNKSKNQKKCVKKAKKSAKTLSTELFPYFYIKNQLFPKLYTQDVENYCTKHFPSGLIIHNAVEK